MPSGCPKLHEKFQHDGNAWLVLKNNFVETSGHIRKKDPSYKPTDEELEAIDYLVFEWDYGYQDSQD